MVLHRLCRKLYNSACSTIGHVPECQLKNDCKNHHIFKVTSLLFFSVLYKRLIIFWFVGRKNFIKHFVEPPCRMAPFFFSFESISHLSYFMYNLFFSSPNFIFTVKGKSFLRSNDSSFYNIAFVNSER